MQHNWTNIDKEYPSTLKHDHNIIYFDEIISLFIHATRQTLTLSMIR